MFTESTLRKRASAINYCVSKGFMHYGKYVYHYPDESRRKGYMVMDLNTGYYVFGCYDSNFDNLWRLDDVEEFLRTKYQELGLKW